MNIYHWTNMMREVSMAGQRAVAFLENSVETSRKQKNSFSQKKSKKTGKEKSEKLDVPGKDLENHQFAQAKEEDIKIQETAVSHRADPMEIRQTKTQDSFRKMELRDAVVWAEILGDPVSRKRKKSRMERGYGNQSYDHRR